MKFDAPQQLPEPGRDEEESPSMAFGLLTSHHTSLDTNHTDGLLLHQLPSGNFRRVGAFTIYGKKEWGVAGYFTQREIVIE
jgi:hypothetical protein